MHHRVYEKTQHLTSGGEYTNVFGGKQDVKAGETVVTGYSNLRIILLMQIVI